MGRDSTLVWRGEVLLYKGHLRLPRLGWSSTGADLSDLRLWRGMCNRRRSRIVAGSPREGRCRCCLVHEVDARNNDPYHEAWTTVAASTRIRELMRMREPAVAESLETVSMRISGSIPERWLLAAALLGTASKGIEEWMPER